MDLGLSGLASGFDWRSLVDQLSEVERSPQQQMRVEQNQIQQRNNAFGSIKTQLLLLQSRVKTLQDPDLFAARKGTASDAAQATVTASAGAAVGSYQLSVSHLATSSVHRGTADIGAPISSTSDVSTLTLQGAGFSTAVSAGTFTVNGQRITVSTTDTLQSVFDQISSSTSGNVTASYDPVGDRIQLASATEIVLGSAADSSNFLEVAKLNNNGTGTLSSSNRLGGVKLSSTLATANLSTTPTDGGSGLFRINGVDITFSASTDKVSDVLKRINDSTAGVTASYDSVNDRFLLTNKATGDLGVSMQDVTGNFLTSSGLLGGSLQRGTDLSYTINGGDSLTSHSNTISAASSGLDALSISVLKEGDVEISVAADTGKIRSAITDFVGEFNKLQSVIDSQTASSTDSKGKVSASALSGDRDAYDIAQKLRAAVFSEVSGVSGAIKHLSSLGYETSGNDNALKLADSTKLDSALESGLADVQSLFSTSGSGIAETLANYLDRTIGEEGSIVQKQDQLIKQSGALDAQITAQEKLVQQNRARLIAGFVAMEQAQANINQQLQYLTKRFG